MIDSSDNSSNSEDGGVMSNKDGKTFIDDSNDDKVKGEWQIDVIEVEKSCCSTFTFIANFNSSSSDTKGEEIMGELKFDVIGNGKSCSNTEDVEYCCSILTVGPGKGSVDSVEDGEDGGVTGNATDFCNSSSNSDDERAVGEGVVGIWKFCSMSIVKKQSLFKLFINDSSSSKDEEVDCNDVEGFGRNCCFVFTGNSGDVSSNSDDGVVGEVAGVGRNFCSTSDVSSDDDFLTLRDEDDCFKSRFISFPSFFSMCFGLFGLYL
jgi:hypothetical protein